MRLEKKYKISTDYELIFAKNDLKNFLKHQKHEDGNFFLFALMEFGTNILKYSQKGEIWLLSEDDDFILAALDKGGGIEDIEWALKKGTSSKNTLGLGLYQLSQNEKYKLEIFTCREKLKGTVALIRPKKEKRMIYLVQNYLDLPYGGDFVLKKGKYVILGDVSGHGKKAFLSAEIIKEFFMKHAFSCIFIDDFLKKLDIKIKKEKIRSLVISILELTRFGVNICGVGTNKLFVKNENIKILTLKDGIIGQVFSSTSKYQIQEFEQIFMTSDGIDVKIMYNILNKSKSLYLSVIAGIYFSKDGDDKAIVGVQNGI